MKSPWNQLNQLQCYVDVAFKMLFYNHRLKWAISRQFFFTFNGLNTEVNLDRVSNFQMCVVIRDLKVFLALAAAALPSSVPTELPWHIGSSRHIKACAAGTNQGWFSWWCLSVLRKNLKIKAEYWKKKIIFLNGTFLIIENQNQKLIMGKAHICSQPCLLLPVKALALGSRISLSCFELSMFDYFKFALTATLTWAIYGTKINSKSESVKQSLNWFEIKGDTNCFV